MKKKIYSIVCLVFVGLFICSGLLWEDFYSDNLLLTLLRYVLVIPAIHGAIGYFLKNKKDNIMNIIGLSLCIIIDSFNASDPIDLTLLRVAAALIGAMIAFYLNRTFVLTKN